jgi:4,5-DOPA dioxygenase extradiol
MTVMPAAFIGHGSPMNALETNRYTAAWRAFGASLPRPRAILCISAHWYINGTAVTAMPQPRTIHDFFGFPPALFAFQYAAPGSVDMAREVAETAKPEFVGMDHDSWGLDHGTWSVLAHLRPAADIPVLQLSIHAGKPAEYHVELGRRLAPLRERGVFILGSGNVVHNLRRIDFRRPELAFDWGERFDGAVKDIMTRRPGAVLEAGAHPDFGESVPTPEHFLPLLYLAGLCDAAGSAADAFLEGCTMGSISMTSYVLQGPRPAAAPGLRDGGAALPDPRIVPSDDTNT